MKGQTLIEVVIAISIIGVVLSGITAVVISSLSNADLSKNQSVATQYAQEGMEIVRQLRNKDYVNFKTYNTNYCLAKGASSLGGSCDVPNVDNFIRVIQITQDLPECGGVNTAKVVSTVSWTDGKCAGSVNCHKSQLVSCVSTVNPIKAP